MRIFFLTHISRELWKKEIYKNKFETKGKIFSVVISYLQCVKIRLKIFSNLFVRNFELMEYTKMNLKPKGKYLVTLFHSYSVLKYDSLAFSEGSIHLSNPVWVTLIFATLRCDSEIKVRAFVVEKNRYYTIVKRNSFYLCVTSPCNSKFFVPTTKVDKSIYYWSAKFKQGQFFINYFCVNHKIIKPFSTSVVCCLFKGVVDLYIHWKCKVSIFIHFPVLIAGPYQHPGWSIWPDSH